MDWAAVGAIGTILAVFVAWYVGTRRSEARVYALAEPYPSQYCSLVVENKSDSPVHVTECRVIWPRGFRLAASVYTRDALGYVVTSPAVDWRSTLSPALTVEPGKSASWLFLIDPPNRDMRISCTMSFHVDVSRWTQITKMRLVKVVQIDATATQDVPLKIIG